MMNDPECVEKKVKIAPHDYSKKNYLATFTPQKQLTPEQIFWSKDLIKMKAGALKEQTTTSRPMKALTVKHDEIEQKNLLIANDNLIADCLSKDVFYTATDYVLTFSRFFDMHEALNAAQKFPVHDRTALDSQTKELHAKINALHDLNERWRAKNETVKRHYKELYDSIKLTHAKHIETTNSLLTKVANLKAELTKHHKSNCVTMPAVNSKVLAPGRYAIDIEPIPPRIRNNREAHLDYLKHLKKSVETLREIVEEANVERPLDRSLSSACLYTKHSQELFAYVIGTCLKDFNQRDKKLAATTVPIKKQVTFMDPYDTSTNNTLTHVKQHIMHQTNEPVIPSVGVNGATAASGSKPRSNTKKDMTLPAKSNMQKVEVHPRKNKSSVKQKNRVDSSISYKRTVKQVWQATGKLFVTAGCSKHKTGDHSRLKNFVKKFIETIRFGMTTLVLSWGMEIT
nr:hypothetical protein [Tanacetum cinerariifolium]